MPPSTTSCSRPCTRVIPSGRRRAACREVAERRDTFGRISSICRKRWLSQASISSGCGSRLPGGRHFRTFAMKTSSRVRPIPARSLPSSCPAAPTNGTPCLSSWKPGRLADEHQVGGRRARAEHDLRAGLRERAARAAGDHVARTQRGQLGWLRASVASSHSSTTAAAAGAAGAAEAWAACWCRGPRTPRTAAAPSSPRSRGRRVSSSADELLEVRLAAHADVLVDRHRAQRTSVATAIRRNRAPRVGRSGYASRARYPRRGTGAER